LLVWHIFCRKLLLAKIPVLIVSHWLFWSLGLVNFGNVAYATISTICVLVYLCFDRLRTNSKHSLPGELLHYSARPLHCYLSSRVLDRRHHYHILGACDVQFFRTCWSLRHSCHCLCFWRFHKQRTCPFKSSLNSYARQAAPTKNFSCIQCMPL